MQSDAVADGDIFAYAQGCANIGVQHTVFLDIAVFAHSDGLVITA